jgi:hypothetical protein
MTLYSASLIVKCHHECACVPCNCTETSYLLEAQLHTYQNAKLHSICRLYPRFAKNVSEGFLYVASNKEN